MNNFDSANHATRFLSPPKRSFHGTRPRTRPRWNMEQVFYFRTKFSRQLIFLLPWSCPCGPQIHHPTPHLLDDPVTLEHFLSHFSRTLPELFRMRCFCDSRVRNGHLDGKQKSTCFFSLFFAKRIYNRNNMIFTEVFSLSIQ